MRLSKISTNAFNAIENFIMLVQRRKKFLLLNKENRCAIFVLWGILILLTELLRISKLHMLLTLKEIRSLKSLIFKLMIVISTKAPLMRSKFDVWGLSMLQIWFQNTPGLMNAWSCLMMKEQFNFKLFSITPVWKKEKTCQFS